MDKQTLSSRLWYVATNGTHRVHGLLAEAQGASSEDPEVRGVLVKLSAIQAGGRTDLSVWNEVMDIRNGAGEWALNS